MDRELVLAVLVALLCGGALTAAGWWPIGVPVAASGRALERWAWRRLWLPFGPALLLFAALCGWAAVEPASAERVPNCLLWGALPFAAVVARAGRRAVRAMRRAQPELGVATVGFLRPRIILSPRVGEALDEPARAAALAHERAHARHRDPLRLWLAQVGSDLLWPWPVAEARFAYWRRALELARDEEARHDGVSGPDLAAAVLVALRCGSADSTLVAATLAGDPSFVEHRIACLLRPLNLDRPATSKAVWWLLAALVLALAAALGSEFGERAVRSLLALA